jgi:predicted RNA binding protein YcfA (HicA-like mRNA interferase family)
VSPKLRTLSGADVVTLLKRFGFETASQRGSHVKLVRQAASGREVLTVPLHKEMDRGTLHAIFNQAKRFISESELRPHFYTD